MQGKFTTTKNTIVVAEPEMTNDSGVENSTVSWRHCCAVWWWKQRKFAPAVAAHRTVLVRHVLFLCWESRAVEIPSRSSFSILSLPLSLSSLLSLPLSFPSPIHFQHNDMYHERSVRISPTVFLPFYYLPSRFIQFHFFGKPLPT